MEYRKVTNKIKNLNQRPL